MPRLAEYGLTPELAAGLLPAAEKLYLRGLDPQARYTIEDVAETRSGLGWMEAGLSLPLGDFESTVRRIRMVR